MLNPLQIGFLSLNAFYSSLGYVVYNYEKYVPASILRVVTHGSFRYKGSDAKYMMVLSLPKGYYMYFYVFACFLGITNLCYMSLVYFCGLQVNEYYARFLHALHGSTSPVSVLASMTALILLTLHCIKRYYETYCIQVFSKPSKVYLTHFIAGWVYYLAVYAAIVGQSPLFCGDKDRDRIVWADSRSIVALVPGVLIFLWACYEQHQSNLILANLRKDKKTGEVVTEVHRIPHGRLFESVSNPHRFCEIMLYVALWCILQTSTFFCILLWVLCNQIQTSMMVHRWYRNTFSTYPKERYAVFKGIL